MHFRGVWKIAWAEFSWGGKAAAETLLPGGCPAVPGHLRLPLGVPQKPMKGKESPIGHQEFQVVRCRSRIWQNPAVTLQWPEAYSLQSWFAQLLMLVS